MAPELLLKAIEREAAALGGRPRIMEVCGTHTAALFRTGLRDLLREQAEIVSGPGCPVCVTPDGVIDAAIGCAAAGFLVATYGDMIRVPGTRSSLGQARAAGGDVRVVTSPLAAADLAAADPGRTVVFLAVGFETTAPGTGILVKAAKARGLDNLKIIAAHKLIPPAMETLLSGGGGRIDAFLCPGHVSVVTGLEPYRRISAVYGIPCVVGGFSAADILEALLMIFRQLREGRAETENQYVRAVKPQGNERARRLLAQVFCEADADWRGLGAIPRSGLALQGDYAPYDAAGLLPATPSVPARPGCACGDVLRGVLSPPECPLFGRVCTPDTPAGPCMVSREGACGLHYTYGDHGYGR